MEIMSDIVTKPLEEAGLFYKNWMTKGIRVSKIRNRNGWKQNILHIFILLFIMSVSIN
jgi:hypothetical protein